MGKLEDYFRTDQQHNVKVTSTNELTLSPSGLKIRVQVYQDFASGSIYFAFYVPEVADTLNTCAGLLADPSVVDRLLEKAPAYKLKSDAPHEQLVDTATLKFNGRIYIYCESNLNDDAIVALMTVADERGLVLQFRDVRWAEYHSAIEKPLAFISHDWREKELAGEIALALVRRGIPVWFSEFSLKVGDSLRESIDKGLKECRRCILLLSPNYLSNPGWTKTEFTSVFTRELIENAKIVLPIWVGVSKQQVYEYSPSLADRVALPIELGVEDISQKLAHEIRPAV